MPPLSRRHLATLVPALAGTLALPSLARAQSRNTIRFVVPFAAGGLTDIIARMLAQHMGATMEQTIVVENRPGGNAIIGTEAVARAPKDGQTVLIGGTAGLTLNAMLRRNLPYAPEDFAPVSLLFDGPLSLTVNASLPARDIAGFVAHARAQREPLRYATLGPGSVGHLFGLMMAQSMGIRLQDVTYRGNGPSTTDLLAGHIEMSLEAPTTTIEHVRSGRLRLLGLSFAERAALFPETPTFKEAGYPDLVTSFWTAMVVPAGSPPEAIARLNEAASRALADAAIRERLAGEALRTIGGPAERLSAQMERDRESWGRIIRDRNIALD